MVVEVFEFPQLACILAPRLRTEESHHDANIFRPIRSRPDHRSGNSDEVWLHPVTSRCRPFNYQLVHAADLALGCLNVPECIPRGVKEADEWKKRVEDDLLDHGLYVASFNGFGEGRILLADNFNVETGPVAKQLAIGPALAEYRSQAGIGVAAGERPEHNTHDPDPGEVDT